MKLIQKKAKLWILIFSPFIIPIFITGWIGGFIYIYLYNGYKSAADFMAKLSGFETNDELVERIINEKLGLNKQGE